MLEVINEWELIDHYCQSKRKSVVYFKNDLIKSAAADKQQEIWDWYAEFIDEYVLDAMKTMGTWDMVVFDNEDVATQNALSWFPTKEQCPDPDYYWECHVINQDGNFVWKNISVPPTA